MKQGSATVALRRCMLACIDEGDFEKAYRIRKVIDQASKLAFVAETYQDALKVRNWALREFNEATDDEVPVASQRWKKAEQNLSACIDYIRRGGGYS